MITPKDIDNLAELARLELSAEEKAGLEKELNNILGFVSEVQKINIGELEKATDSQTINTMRDDIVTTETGENTEVLINASPEKEKDYVKVRKILGLISE